MDLRYVHYGSWELVGMDAFLPVGDNRMHVQSINTQITQVIGESERRGGGVS